MPDLAVRTADRDDHTDITAVLGRAFQVEPVYPAYLECSDANVAYYERFGFAVRDTVVVDETLSCRAMWRIPGPSPA